MNMVHLQILLALLHSEQIRQFSTKQPEQAIWKECNIIISIDGAQYTIKFYNGRDANQCQALSIVLGKSVDIFNADMLHIMYCPDPCNVSWLWYDDVARQFSPYQRDELQLYLELEAAYQANRICNFPHANMLLIREYKKSIFSCCFLQRLSSLEQRKARYAVQFTPDPSHEGEAEVTMDLVNTDTGVSISMLRRQCSIRTCSQCTSQPGPQRNRFVFPVHRRNLHRRNQACARFTRRNRVIETTKSKRTNSLRTGRGTG